VERFINLNDILPLLRFQIFHLSYLKFVN